MSTDLYDVIARRRDVRAEFSGGAVDCDVLRRGLQAAHSAPSVGHSQPWDFVLVADAEKRATFAEHGGQHVLGRHAIADTGLYSTCPASQNLWLAATAAGLGVGWVSFYREEFLADLVGLPDGVRPVAWLCLGPVEELQEVPDLVRHGWRKGRSLDDAVHLESWSA
ncbi:nitroreductase family protein [Nocardioides sp.]|uniref:nitroreductase family protein n=1 Tax=Nocardioides sp. TaxID=35761 RepID=UPI00260B316D|nr:nitroreductase family protein [Nocardioides sp.]MCW2738501.1 cob(II)yrinic acid a,c-diamide reductase [Nocardioides sp.]